MQPLLSDLCSICHKNPPKYRCPACSTRTCSLECVQKHKNWGCSGKRDPTSYVKKSQLATPSGVDHDFNFLSGIERSRDRADEQLQGRSIQDAEGRSTRLNQPAFRARLQLARVIIEYAPLGMSRQKLNKTRLTQSKRINWTVQWIHEDATSSIGSIFDDEQIYVGYRPLHLKRTGVSRKKRKREDGAPATPETLNLVQDITTSPVTNPVDAKELIEGSTLKRDHESAASREPLATEANNKSAAVTTVVPVAIAGESSEVDAAAGEKPSRENVAITNESSQTQERMALPAGSQDDLGLWYYLVKTRTSGLEKVLVPLSPTDTFLTCLQNQTVLEFPTVQVLPYSPDALPAGFVTEAQYLTRYRKEAHEMQQLIEDDGEIESDPDPKAEDRNATPSQHSPPIVQDTDTVMPNPSTLLATLDSDMRG